MFPKSANRFDYVKEGPGAYDVKHGMLSEDPNKHFGFIDKAQRFKHVKPGTLNPYSLIGAEDRLEDDENVNPVEKATQRQISRAVRSDKEDVLKMKLDLDKWQDSYKRLQMSHEKDIAILEDKIFKNDTQLQTVIKEKSAYMSTASSKDREVNDLVHKESRLRLNVHSRPLRFTIKLEKSEKQVSTMQDKLSQMTQFQKKLEDAEKINLRLRAQVERKVIDEHAQKDKEQLERRVNLLQKEIESFKTENQSLQTSMINSRTSLADVRIESEKSAELWKRQLSKKSSELDSERIGNQRAVSVLDSQLSEVRGNFENIKTCLDRKLADMHDSLKDSRQENATLNADFKKLQQSTSKSSLVLQSQLDDTTQSKAALESQLARITAEKNEHQIKFEQSLKEYDHKLFQKQQLLNASEDVVSQKTVAFSTLNSDYSDVVAKYENETAALSNQLVQQKCDSRATDLQNDEMLQQLESLTYISLSKFANALQLGTPANDGIFDSIPTLLQEYASRISGTMASMETRIKQYGDQIKTLSLHGSEKDDSLALLQSEYHASLTKMEADIRAKASKIVELIAAAEDAGLKIDELTLAESELTESLEESHMRGVESTQTIADLEKSLADVESQLMFVNEENSIARVESNNRIKALTANFADNEAKLRSVETSLTFAADERDSLSASLEHSQSSLAQTSSALQVKTELGSALQAKLDFATGERKISEIRVTDLCQQLVRLEDDLQQLSSVGETQKTEIAELSVCLKMSQECASTHARDLDVADLLKSDLNKQIELNAQQFIALNNDASIASSTIYSQLADIDQLNASLEETRNTLSYCEQEFENYKDIAGSFKDDSMREAKLLTERAALLDGQIAELVSSVTLLQSELTQTRSDGQFLEISSNEQALELVRVNASKELLNESLSLVKVECQSLTAELYQLKSDHTAFKSTSGNVECELRESVSHLEENLRIETEKVMAASSQLEELEAEFTTEKLMLQDSIHEQSDSIHALELEATGYEFRIEELSKQGNVRDIEYKRTIAEGVVTSDKLALQHDATLNELRLESDLLNDSLVIATNNNNSLLVEKTRLANALAVELKKTAELVEDLAQRSLNHVHEYDQLEEKTTRLQYAVDQKTSDIATLTADKATLKLEVQMVQEQLDRATQDHTLASEVASETIDALSLQLHATETQNNITITEKDDALANLSAVLQEKDNAYDLLDFDLATLTTDFNNTEMLKRKLTLEKADLAADNSAMKLSMTQSDQKIYELEREKTVLHREANELLEKSAKLDRDNKTMTFDRKESAEKCKNMQFKHDEMEDSMKREAEQSEKKIAAMGTDFATRLEAVAAAKKQAEYSLSSQKIIHANENSGREIQLKYLEDKVKESAILSESSRDADVTIERLKQEAKQGRIQLEDVNKKYTKLVKEGEDSKKRLLLKSTMGDKQSNEFQTQALDWKAKYLEAIKLKDSVTKTCDDKVSELTKKLAIMTTKDKIASEEMSRIANMDDEAFGHSNANQKIKHVHTLKTQNMHLKQAFVYLHNVNRQEKMTLENINVNYRRKIDELERELESARVEEGPYTGKKLPKVARSFMALIGASNLSNIQTDESFFVDSNEGSNKENGQTI